MPLGPGAGAAAPPFNPALAGDPDLRRTSCTGCSLPDPENLGNLKDGIHSLELGKPQDTLQNLNLRSQVQLPVRLLALDVRVSDNPELARGREMAYPSHPQSTWVGSWVKHHAGPPAQTTVSWRRKEGKEGAPGGR